MQQPIVTTEEFHRVFGLLKDDIRSDTRAIMLCEHLIGGSSGEEKRIAQQGNVCTVSDDEQSKFGVDAPIILSTLTEMAQWIIKNVRLETRLKDMEGREYNAIESDF